ncbi:MAG TPA: hypothetical protein PKE12_15945 [Kiritimatiellia bacterium]|nr:hypothetical protein [Kiritimatiellia bacterium]
MSLPFRNRGAVLLSLVAALGVAACGRMQDCDVLPHGPIEVLSLKRGELPEGYQLLRDPALEAALHLLRNPDYVRKPADMELVARAGGLASFLALYGTPANDVRLVINGVYFRDPVRCNAFVALQREKRRQVIAFRRTEQNGIWLLLVARNPEQAYDAAEIARLRAALARYAARLDLEPLFDRLENGDAP